MKVNWPSTFEVINSNFLGKSVSHQYHDNLLRAQLDGHGALVINNRDGFN